VARFGYRLVYAAGLLLLGAPALALTVSASMAVILAVSVVRGVGLAIVVVVGSALVASLVPRERRGEGLGLLGVVVGVPSIVALPLGVWLAREIGYPPVFVTGALASVVALAVIPGLPDRAPAPGAQSPFGITTGVRMPALVRPSLVLAATAMATGVVVTFLPLVLPPSTGDLAAWALLAQALSSTLSRWWAGHHGDRHDAHRLIAPGVLATAAGALALVMTASPAAVVIGMVLLGAGFGMAQNATLALMFDRVTPSGYDTVSALWNLAYDAGLGLGGVGFGVLASRTGYPAAFAVTAAVVLGALVPAWRDRRRTRS
jgi:predicted MFS family arabinose efflux permease